MGSILPMQWPLNEQQRDRQFDALHVVAGTLHQLHGRLSVIAGTVLHNDIMRARGHRQQVVGLLQRFWRRDRRSVEAWVDALVRRGKSRRAISRCSSTECLAATHRVRSAIPRAR